MGRNKGIKNVYIFIYVCIIESLCCTAEINITLQINYTLIKFKKEKREKDLAQHLADRKNSVSIKLLFT